jgi:enamine deaminase RidA (YjgF/YER057c/UK114 family)
MARPEQRTHRREALEKHLGFAQAVRAGDTVYLSGVCSIDQDGQVRDPYDMPAQIRNVYSELRQIVAQQGLSFADVVKETIYTTELDKLAEHAAGRLEYFDAVALPAASWVEVRRLFSPALLLEVEFTLYAQRTG